MCSNLSYAVLETWSGTKPYINHLRVFDAYAHIHKHQRTKMEPKSVKGIFIGYDSIKENGLFPGAKQNLLKQKNQDKKCIWPHIESNMYF